MKILIAPTASGNIRKTAEFMKENLQTMGRDIAIELWQEPGRPVTCADIKKSEADLFVNFNLSGFEQSTLTDGIAYNLLDCKQVHFLLADELANEKFLARLLSISMFFYCADEDLCRKLREKYLDIPYLKIVEGWEKDGEKSPQKKAETLCQAVREVLEICQMV